MVEISMNTIYVMKSNQDDVERISIADNNVGRIGAGGKRKTKKYKKTVGKRKLNARRKTRRYKKSKK
jgi:Zn/Cd-binding protein ZinT